MKLPFIRTKAAGCVMLLSTAGVLCGQVPSVVTYQGRITASGTNYSGLGYFKFALIAGSVNLSRQATAYATVAGGAVTSVNLSDGGAGYQVPPAVTFMSMPGGPVGAGAAATATVSGGTITAIVLQNPGSNYWGGAVVTIAAPPANIPMATFWSDNGSSVDGSEPSLPVQIPVANGLFIAQLGLQTQDSLTSMVPIDPVIFTNASLQLRIWFSPDGAVFQQLSPDQPLTSSPYTMMAANAANAANLTGGTYSQPLSLNNASNSFTGSGAGLTGLRAENIASGTLSDARLSTNVALLNASQTFTGRNIFKNATDTSGEIQLGLGSIGGGTNAIYLGGGRNVSVAQASGSGRMDLKANSFSFQTDLGSGNVGIGVSLPLAKLDVAGSVRASGFVGDGSGVTNISAASVVGLANLPYVAKTGDTMTGPLVISPSLGNRSLTVTNAAADGRAILGEADNSYGAIGILGRTVHGTGVKGEATGSAGWAIWGVGPANGKAGQFDGAVEIDGDTAVHGNLSVSTNVTVRSLAASGSLTAGGNLSADGNLAVAGKADIAGIVSALGVVASGSAFPVVASGTLRGLEATASSPAGYAVHGVNTNFDTGFAGYFDGNLRATGDATIDGALAVGDSATIAGRTSTGTLLITGGADITEPFEISGDNIPAGAVVVIDEEHPGRMKLSQSAYDRHVGGVVSGAHGVHPGLSLSQFNPLGGGRQVALTGRVYVQADASKHPIRPGDLLTTSDQPGCAMSVQDYSRAQGAILGKAMGGLPSGQGLVLVLVTLQ